MVIPLLTGSTETFAALSVPDVLRGFMEQREVRLSLQRNPSPLSPQHFDTRLATGDRHDTLTFTGFQSFGSLIRIKHPLIGFIEELTRDLRQVSDQSLRTQSEREAGRSEQSVNKSVELLLAKLERGEKILELISHSLPSLDKVQTLARESAHKCAGLVRELRRDLSGSSRRTDLSKRTSKTNLTDLLDRAYNQLFAEKLAFERAVVELIKSDRERCV